MSIAITLMVPFYKIDVLAPFSAAFTQIPGWGWCQYLVSVGAVFGIGTVLLVRGDPRVQVIAAFLSGLVPSLGVFGRRVGIGTVLLVRGNPRVQGFASFLSGLVPVPGLCGRRVWRRHRAAGVGGLYRVYRRHAWPTGPHVQTLAACTVSCACIVHACRETGVPLFGLGRMLYYKMSLNALCCGFARGVLLVANPHTPVVSPCAAGSGPTLTRSSSNNPDP